jgi:protein-disulfide isomerase
MLKDKLTFLNVIIGICVLGLVITLFLLIQFSIQHGGIKAFSGKSANSTDKSIKENNADYNNSANDIKPVENREEKLLISEKDHLWGDADSPVKMIIYTDFQCPFCGDFHESVEQIKKEYEGKIAIVIRHNPLPAHVYAFGAAEASECASEQGKFWEMYGKLFEDNETGRLSPDEFKNHAKELKLDEKKFNSCLDEHKYKEAIAWQMLTGKDLGANGTPTFFVNGNIYPGAYPLEDFPDSNGNIEKGLRNIIKTSLEASG